ncbi:hypothetical protein D9M71_664380 [compost metagenome]
MPDPERTRPGQIDRPQCLRQMAMLIDDIECIQPLQLQGREWVARHQDGAAKRVGHLPDLVRHRAQLVVTQVGELEQAAQFQALRPGTQPAMAQVQADQVGKMVKPQV